MLLKHAVFASLGITSLSSWNSIITVPSFFKERLVDTAFKDTFLNIFSILFMLTNTLLLAIMLKYKSLISIKYRLYSGMFIMLLVFISFAIVSKISFNGPVFFYFSCTLVFLAAIGNSLVSGVFGLATNYPVKYTVSLSIGQGIAGLLPSIANLVRIFISTRREATTSELSYFLVAIVFLASSILGFHYLNSHDSPPLYESIIDNEEIPIEDESNLIITDWHGIVILAACELITFTITLSVYPAITSSIQPSDNSSQSRNNLFTALHFLIYNIGDIIGKSLPAFNAFFIKTPRKLLMYSLLRILFVIALVSYQIKSIKLAFPILLNDPSFLLILFFFSVSSGLISTNCFMVSLKISSSQDGQFASDFLVLALALGLSFGSLSSFAIAGLINVLTKI